MTADEVKRALDVLENPSDASFLQKFFKTHKGSYGEGDVFIGVRVPMTRKVAKRYKALPLSEIEQLLESPIHEHRLAALIIMVLQAGKASEAELQQLYDLYLRRTDRINNWDLVDTSCRSIVGQYLLHRPRWPLYRLARSDDLWERRIAIVSTWQFIREQDLDDTFKISEMLLGDEHDIIHKAVGWMLREAGKKDESRLLQFLDVHAATMPRTALRYSIERLNAVDKQHYMTLKLKQP